MPFSARALRHTVALLTLSGLFLFLTGLWTNLDGLPAMTGAFLKFRVPQAAAVDPRGRLFVADAAGQRLVAADRDGSLRWQRHASAESGGFTRLISLSTDQAGRLYTLDGGRNRVVRLKPDGSTDQVLFAPPTGRIEAFEVFVSGGWALVREGGLLRTYQIALDGTSRAPVRELAGGPDLLGPVPSPWGEVAGPDAEGNLWRSVPSGGWEKVLVTIGQRITAARYLSGGTLLCLNGADRTWWIRGPLEPGFRLLRGPPDSPGEWSPLPSAGSDGSLVFCDPEGASVRIDGGPWATEVRTGARLSVWDRLRPWLGWFLTAGGAVLLGAAFVSAARNLLRRAFDVQILSLAVLLPGAFLLTVGLQHTAFDAFDRNLTLHRGEALSEGAAVASAELEAAGDRELVLDRIFERGLRSGTYERVRLLEVRGPATAVVSARPEFWTAGRMASGLPFSGGQTSVREGPVDYEDPEALRQSEFRRLRSGLILELGRNLEPAALADQPVYRNLHFLALGITLLFLGGLAGLGAALLAASAPRHRLARVLTSRKNSGPDALRAFFPRTAREWSAGRGSEHGTVIGLSWGLPAQAREAFQTALARSVREVGVFARSEGALVTDVRPEGLLILAPGNREDGLTLAREVAARWRPFRCAVDAGPWAWETVRLADRQDLRPSGDAVRGVLMLLEWEPTLALGLTARSGYLAECPEVPWRPAGRNGGQTVGQILDPADPDQAALLDYLTPFRAAFDAWNEGRAGEARERVTFLLGRMPEDPVLRRLAAEVLS